MDEHGDVRPLVEVEEDMIRFALDLYRGDVSQAARRLGIGRSTLYRKLRGLANGETAPDPSGRIGLVSGARLWA